MYSYISGELAEVNEDTIVVDNHGNVMYLSR